MCALLLTPSELSGNVFLYVKNLVTGQRMVVPIPVDWESAAQTGWLIVEIHTPQMEQVLLPMNRSLLPNESNTTRPTNGEAVPHGNE